MVRCGAKQGPDAANVGAAQAAEKLVVALGAGHTGTEIEVITEFPTEDDQPD